MILTLYKNCILNEKYIDVYDTRINDNTSPLNEYLNSLEKITIEIDNVYIKDSGTIILPYESNINNVLFNAFDYNYMKMESDDGEITRYAFINKGELGNNIAKVDYTQDIWSNWSNKCKVERGIISKISEPNSVYQSSNSIDIVSYGTVNVTEDLIDSFNVFIELQPHNLVTGAGIETRWQLSGYMQFEVDNQPDTFKSNLTIDEVGEVVRYLLQYENTNCFDKPNVTNGGFYYDISRIFIVPSSNILNTPDDENTYVFTYNSGTTYLRFIEQKTGEYKIQEKNFAPSNTGSEYMRRNALGFGIIGATVPFGWNGIGCSISINMVLCADKISIFQEINGTLNDVTDLFRIEPYFSTAGDAETQQRIISYNLQKQLQVTNGVKQVVNSTIGIFSGTAQALSGDVVKGLTNVAGSLSNGTFGVIETIMKHNALTKPQFGNFMVSSNSGSAFITAMYGIQQYVPSNESNEASVNAINGMIGYDTIIPINSDDLFFDNLFKSDRRTVTFSFINIVGEAPNYILRELENILSDTTVIHTNGTIS